MAIWDRLDNGPASAQELDTLFSDSDAAVWIRVNESAPEQVSLIRVDTGRSIHTVEGKPRKPWRRRDHDRGETAQELRELMESDIAWLRLDYVMSTDEDEWPDIESDETGDSGSSDGSESDESNHTDSDEDHDTDSDGAIDDLLSGGSSDPDDLLRAMGTDPDEYYPDTVTVRATIEVEKEADLIRNGAGYPKEMVPRHVDVRVIFDFDHKTVGAEGDGHKMAADMRGNKSHMIENLQIESDGVAGTITTVDMVLDPKSRLYNELTGLTDNTVGYTHTLPTNGPLPTPDNMNHPDRYSFGPTVSEKPKKWYGPSDSRTAGTGGQEPPKFHQFAGDFTIKGNIDDTRLREAIDDMTLSVTNALTDAVETAEDES